MRGRASFIAILLTSVVGLTSSAAADVRPYGALSGGVDFPSDPAVEVAGLSLGNIETGTGFALGVAGGVDFGSIRTELRLDIRRANVTRTTGPAAVFPQIPTSGNIGVLGIVPEVNFDYPILNDRLELHTGFGLGAAQLRDTTFTDWGFAYTFNAGVYWPIAKPIGLDLSYRFTGVASGFDTPNNTARIVWRDNALVAGVRIYFTGWRE